QEYCEEILTDTTRATEYFDRTSSFYIYGCHTESNFCDMDIYDMKDDQNIFDSVGYGLESELATLFNSESMYQAYYNLENDCRMSLTDEYDLDDLEIELENSI